MYKKYIIPAVVVFVLIGSMIYLSRDDKKSPWPQKKMVILNDENDELETENSFLRAKYEWTISRDLKKIGRAHV